MLLVCGDLNGHVGKTSSGFEGLHGGHGYGVRNPEGTRILELCVAADLVITNTFFTKCDSQLLTFRSGNACSQTDYILVRKSDFKSVRDVKVIGGEECVSQHKLLVGDFELNTSFSKSRCTPPKRKLWKLSNPEVRLEYGNCVHESAQSFQNPQNSDSAWTEIKTCLLNACDTVCGWTRGGKLKCKETWWWNDEVDYYRGLKLLDQVMKVMEHTLATIIRTQVDIDAMQFGFMPGRGTTNAIFILRQVHEKYLGKHKDLYFAFVDLEKAFDRVPRKVLWWALRKVGVDEWLIRTIQAMYTNAKSSVRINGQFSSWFDVQVGVHQGSVLNPLLIIIVMEALSHHF